MYAPLFETCYKHSITKKDGGNAFVKYCDFLRQCRTDVGIVSDLIKKTPLHVLATNDADRELVRHDYEIIREHLISSNSNNKVVSLCIPTFEFDAKDKKWLITKSVRKIRPTRVDETSMTFEFDLKASELHNHYNLQNYDMQSYARTVFYDDSERLLFDARDDTSLHEDVIFGNDVDFLRLFISFDVLDPRSVSEEHILKCYSSITINFGEESRDWIISPDDADVSSFKKSVSVRIGTSGILDYFAHLMAMNDVKKCFYDLKLCDIFTSVDGVVADTYFRDIWYRNTTVVEQVNNLCRGMFDNTQKVNVVSQRCHNLDLLEYVKLNVTGGSFGTADWDDRFDRYYATNGSGDGTSDCGYIFEHDVECRGNYGWFDSGKNTCKRKHFPTLAPELRFDFTNKIYVINSEAAGLALQKDFAHAFREYLRLRFNVALSEKASHFDVCYDFSLSGESSPETLISRIDETRSKLFSQPSALRTVPYDVMRRDITDEENECSSLARTSLQFLTVRNLTLYKDKETKIKRSIQQREIGRSHSGFQDDDIKANLNVFRGILRRPKKIADVSALSKQLSRERYHHDTWIYNIEYDDFVTWRSHNYGDISYECSSDGLPTERALDACEAMHANDVFGTTWRSAFPTVPNVDMVCKMISSDKVYRAHKSVAVDMLTRTDEEYPYSTHTVDSVHSNACFGCAQPMWRYYDQVRAKKYPKSHIYDVRGLALAISVPRHDSKKSYLGCCGYLSDNRYHFYGVHWYDEIGEAFDSSKQSHFRIMQGLNDACDAIPKKKSNRLKHYTTEGGIKPTFIHDVTTFAARYHHGYLNVVDFDTDLMYAVIGGVSGLPKTLTGATQRQPGLGRGAGYGRRERCFAFLNTVESSISAIKVGWRRRFCDMKTKIVRALRTSRGIVVDKSLENALRSHTRTGSVCVLKSEDMDFGNDRGRRIAYVEKCQPSEVRAEYPADVRTDWCFLPHAYSAIKRMSFETVKNAKIPCDRESTRNPYSLGRLFAQKTCRFEDVKNWKECDDRVLCDETVSKCLYALKIRATMAPYAKMVSILEGLDRRLSLSDAAYCIVEDYVFDNCETDLQYRDGSRFYDSHGPVAIFCNMLRDIVGDDTDIRTPNALSYYNAIRSIVYNWTHSFVMSEISMVVKYERLLEGVLYHTSNDGGTESFKRYSPGSAKFNRRFGLDFFLGLRNLFASRDLVHFNQPLSERIGVRYADESNRCRTEAGDVFLSAVGRMASSDTITRCQCIDCSCGSVNALSEYGGFYSCVTTSSDRLRTLRFDYVFGVRRHYMMASVKERATVDLYDDTTTSFDIRPSTIGISWRKEERSFGSDTFYGRRDADTLDRRSLCEVSSRLDSSSNSLYRHAWRCCEYVAQQKIHDAVNHRAATFVPDGDGGRSSCIKMILSTIEKVGDIGDDAGDFKKFESEDYIYLYDLGIEIRPKEALMNAQINTLWAMLLSKNMGLGEDYVFESFGYANLGDAHKIPTISKFASRALTFFFGLPTARISQDSSAKISAYVPDVKCAITKDAVRVKCDRSNTLYVETTVTTSKINLFDKTAPTWCCIPLFMVVFRTYLNLASVLDEMFDPRKSSLFKDSKYALSAKLKMSLYLCIELGSIEVPRLPKYFDSEFTNPFAFVDHAEAIDIFHTKGDRSHGPDCDDFLSDVSDVLKELGEFAKNFYEKLVNRDDDGGERPAKKRRKNDVERAEIVTDDVWRKDFGKKKYTERELANALYAQAITTYSALFKSRGGMGARVLSDMVENVENTVAYCSEDPSFFLNVITNVLWYDGAKLYCENRYVMETGNENIDIISDVNEFI